MQVPSIMFEEKKKDIIVTAETGSGKSLAFIMPLLG